MSKYRTITGVYGYQYGIFENGSSELQSNGRRMRTLCDVVRWTSDSTGGHHTAVRYLTIADGRKLLRECRQARIAELRGKLDYYSPDIADLLAG